MWEIFVVVSVLIGLLATALKRGFRFALAYKRVFYFA